MVDLPTEFVSSTPTANLPGTESGSILTGLEGVERDTVKTTIYACRGNLTQAAEKLGIAKSTLYQKIKEYGLAQEVANARARTAETTRD
jgi:sigma-54 dependent transcriptional regulator, acetoin dehydrogenase operon transcriptional activator AcoR